MFSFQSKSKPTVSIDQYFTFLAIRTGASEEAIVSAVGYIFNLRGRCPTFLLNTFTIHRLVLTSLRLATKFVDDVFYTNNIFAYLGGITLPDMNDLELRLLKLLDYQVAYTLDEFSNLMSLLSITILPQNDE